MNNRISRRDVLKWLSVGTGSMILAACGAKVTPTEATQPPEAEPTAVGEGQEPTKAPEQPTKAPVVEAVIVTTGWPIGLMPDEATQEADPTQKVYAQVLQEWLDMHPGVSLEGSNVNIWGAQDITTAIAGGTAPMYYSGGALGGWSEAGQMAAFAQGLAADVTALVDKYKVKERTIAAAVKRWEFFKVGGKYFGFPQEFNVGNGIYYRLDLLKEAGFEPPKKDWTWDDFRAMAKAMNSDQVRGLVAQVWGHTFPIQGFAGGDDGRPFMELPNPSGSWHYKYMHHAQPVVDACTLYRTMMWDDKIILSDATFTDTEVNAVFNRGEAATMFNNAGYYVLPGDQGIQGLETMMGIDRGELVGWSHHPRGSNGGLSGTQSFVHIMCLDPNATPELLDLGYNLYDYFTFGDGFIKNSVGNYEATKNLRFIFTAYPMINGFTEIPGIPGTIYDAWPKHYLDAVDYAASLPQLPGKGMYLPPELNPAPPDSAFQDALNQITFDETSSDVTGLLGTASDLRNQQAATYKSSMAVDEFRTGLTGYYNDYNKIIMESAPEYYNTVWKPFFEANIAPEIG